MILTRIGLTLPEDRTDAELRRLITQATQRYFLLFRFFREGEIVNIDNIGFENIILGGVRGTDFPFPYRGYQRDRNYRHLINTQERVRLIERNNRRALMMAYDDIVYQITYTELIRQDDEDLPIQEQTIIERQPEVTRQTENTILNFFEAVINMENIRITRIDPGRVPINLRNRYVRRVLDGTVHTMYDLFIEESIDFPNAFYEEIGIDTYYGDAI